MDEIQKAHVICIVYSVDDEDTLDRAASYWLPLVRKCSSSNRCPVVLVGNKIDLVDYSTIEVSSGRSNSYGVCPKCNGGSMVFFVFRRCIL